MVQYNNNVLVPLVLKSKNSRKDYRSVQLEIAIKNIREANINTHELISADKRKKFDMFTFRKVPRITRIKRSVSEALYKL